MNCSPYVYITLTVIVSMTILIAGTDGGKKKAKAPAKAPAMPVPAMPAPAMPAGMPALPPGVPSTPGQTCIAGWKDNHTYYEDETCARYPDLCAIMPKPPAASFAAFTEPFPCFMLNQEIIAKVREAQDVSKTSFEKCMWDYAICFLNACYPGMDPRVILELIQSGKLVPKNGLPGVGQVPGAPDMPSMPAAPPGMPSGMPPSPFG